MTKNATAIILLAASCAVLFAAVTRSAPAPCQWEVTRQTAVTPVGAPVVLSGLDAEPFAVERVAQPSLGAIGDGRAARETWVVLLRRCR